MKLTIDLHLSWKNGLSVVAGVCVVLLAIIPLNVEPAHLGWLRWQVAIYVLTALAVSSLGVQALIQSKEDHRRDQKELERDTRQENIESQLTDLRQQLRTGTPKPPITENVVVLEPPALPAPLAPDIDGEAHRVVVSPRSAAWPIVRDVYKLQGRPDDAVVDTDILVEMYLVNQNLKNPQYIRDIHLSAEVNGKRTTFQRQDDLLAGPFADIEFEYGIKVDGSSELEPLKLLFDKFPVTLQPQQPADGWVRFMAKEINADKISNGTIELTIVNSLGKEFSISKASTSPRKGEIGLRRLRS